MKRAVLLCLLLVACSNDNPSPPPPAPPYFTGAVAPSAFVVTHGSAGVAMSNGTMDFPACASADQCWVSYVEAPLWANIANAKSISVDYQITGSNPQFGITSQAAACPGHARPVFILHRAGDNMSGLGAYNYYRWFSHPQPGPDFSLGQFSYSVPLNDITHWGPVNPGQPGADAGFVTAKANIGQLGIGFGGGCFAAHGVAVTSGNAAFRLLKYSVQ